MSGHVDNVPLLLNRDRLLLLAQAVESLCQATSLLPDSAQYHYCLGRAHSYAGDSNAAIVSYRKSLELRDADKECHLYLALELNRVGEYAAAEQAVRRALAIDPSYAEGHRVLGDVFLSQVQPVPAVESFCKALGIEGSNLRARVGVGQSLYLLGRFAEAIEDLRLAAVSSREATYLLSRCYSLNDRFAEAVPLLTDLTSRPDSQPDVYYYLGCAHAHLSNFPMAIDAFGRCLEREPNHWRAHVQRGHSYLSTQDVERARADYERARTLQPENVEVVLAFARLQLQQQEYGDAGRHLELAVQLQPGLWDAHMLLGALAERDGDWVRSEKAYLRALELDMGCAETWNRLALLYCHQGNFRAAIECFRLPPAQVNWPDTMEFHWGYALAHSGDFAGALDHWEKLQSRHPEDKRLALNINQLHYLLGKQHADAERYEEAIEEWELFLALRPEDEKLMESLAELLLRRGVSLLAKPDEGDTKTASAALEAAVRLNGSNPLPRYYLGLCKLAEGKHQETVELLTAATVHEPSGLHARSAYHTALALLALGQSQDAVNILEPVSEEAHLRERGLPVELVLATSYAHCGRWEEALKVLEPIVR